MLNTDSRVMGSRPMDLSGRRGELIENDVRYYIAV